MQLAPRPTLSVLALTLSAAVAPVASAGDLLSIRTLAPEKSVLVLGADDIHASKERWEKTPLARWWNADETQKAMKEWRDEMEQSIGEWTQELGVPRDAVTCPASLGAAAFLQVNEETGAMEPAFILFVDWGKDTEGFVQLYDAATQKLEKDKPMPFAVEEIKGRRVYVFSEPKPVDGGEDDEFMAPDPLGDMKLCVTRDAGRLLLSGGTAAMGDLLSRLDGSKERAVADNDDFKGSMELVGGAPDVYAAIVTEKAMAFLTAAQPEAMFMLGMATPFIQPLVGDIRGWSFGVSLDTSKGPMSQSVAAYVPAGRVGLLSLLGTSPVEPVPSVVPGDAVSYGRLNVKLSGVMKVVDDVLARLPEEMRAGVRENLDPMMPQLNASFGAMGNAMHMWTPAESGVAADPDALASMTAVPITDPKAAQGLLELMGGAAMLKPRDFLGNTIYSTDDPLEPAFGFSAQYMLMGPTKDVEVALRALGSKDNASLTADRAYQAASATWSKGELVGWGFSNTIAMLESLEGLSDADMMPFGGDLDEAMPGEMDFDAFEEVLKPEFLKKYFGPTSWQVSAPKTGLRADFFVLGADSEVAGR